jgi:hypothetical protein
MIDPAKLLLSSVRSHPSSILRVLSLALLLSCSGGKSDAPTTPAVRAAPVSRVVITPSTLAMGPWETAKLTATAYDSAGNQLNGRAITWASSSSTLLSVDGSGSVTSNLLGAATISASAEGISASSQVTIATTAGVTVGPNVSIDPAQWAGETSVTVNPKNPLNIGASANYYYYSSRDGGRTWKSTLTSSPDAQGDPNVAFDASGVLFRQGLNLDASPRGTYVVRSTDGGQTLGARVAAYSPVKGAGEPDQGIMTIDTVSKSPYLGNVYIISSDYPDYVTPISYTRSGFPLLVVTSRDGGATWSTPVDISDCPNSGQEASSYITTGVNGEVFAAWRGTCSGRRQWTFTRSLDGGRTWAPNITAHFSAAPPPFPLADDVRGNMTIDVDRSNGPSRGTIYISGNDEGADALLIRSTDGGNTWSNPIFLSDGPRGQYKYYFQPHINVAPNGRIDAAWYDTRNWAGTDNNHVTYDLYYSYSTNGGLSFSPSVRVTTFSSVMNHNCPSQQACGDRSIGEYIGLASDNTRAMPVWTDRRGSTPQPYFATIWIKP